jgi:hypothetical protein
VVSQRYTCDYLRNNYWEWNSAAPSSNFPEKPTHDYVQMQKHLCTEFRGLKKRR